MSFCRLLIDETIDLLKTLTDDAKDHELIEFDDKVGDTIERLRRAQQDFPNEAEFPNAEGQFWSRLGESDRASRAFEKAITVRPRNSGAFARLSRIQKVSGSYLQAEGTLTKALEQFPKDKYVHLQMAMLKFDMEPENAQATEYHLKSSFGPGDHNFEARFLLAGFLFWAGRASESKKHFDEIDAKAPDSFRKHAPTSDDVITSKLGEYIGTVEAIKERFFFIRFGGYPARILAHMSSLVDVSFDELQAGDSIMFKIRFNRRGPVAVATWSP